MLTNPLLRGAEGLLHWAIYWVLRCLLKIDFTTIMAIVMNSAAPIDANAI
jgi:hypothetical protein